MDRMVRFVYCYSLSRRLNSSLHRFNDINDAFALWEEYVNIANSYLSNISMEKQCTIRFKKLLGNPLKTVTKLCQFCELDKTYAEIEKIVGKINFTQGRAYAHRRDPEMRSFAQKHARELSIAGYEDTLITSL